MIMLVLTRRYGDEVVIMLGEREVVKLIVLKTGATIQIGFDALPDVRILRGEVLNHETDLTLKIY